MHGTAVDDTRDENEVDQNGDQDQRLDEKPEQVLEHTFFHYFHYTQKEKPFITALLKLSDFLDLSRLTGTVSEIEQSCSSDFTDTENSDLVDDR